MKKFLLTILLLLFCLPSFGQKIRFCDSTNRWRIYSIAGHPVTSWVGYCEYTAKVIRDSIEYSKMNGSVWTPSGLCLVREDTINSKVFVRIIPNYGGSGVDTTEQVLYDYSWQLGDTVIRNVRGYFKHVISNVDSTLINGLWHKVWHFQKIESDHSAISFDVIEGIGCTNDPIFPLFPENFESYSQVSCFSNSANGTPLVSPTVSGFFNNTTSCTLDIDNVSNSRNVVVSPNPTNGHAKIIFPQTIKSGVLILINSIGQTIANIPFQNKDELLIGDKVITPGLYCYRLIDNTGGEMYVGKFVKE